MSKRETRTSAYSNTANSLGCHPHLLDDDGRYWLDEPPPESWEATPNPEDYMARAEDDEQEPPHSTSPTGTAAESLRSGLFPAPPARSEVMGEDERLRAGDPGVDPLAVEYSGDEVPGSDMSTPDQNSVDEIGRAYGITEQDAGELRLGDEPVAKRDARRWELDPASAERF
jgi:hypothetical protein